MDARNDLDSARTALGSIKITLMLFEVWPERKETKGKREGGGDRKDRRESSRARAIHFPNSCGRAVNEKRKRKYGTCARTRSRRVTASLLKTGPSLLERRSIPCGETIMGNETIYCVCGDLCSRECTVRRFAEWRGAIAIARLRSVHRGGRGRKWIRRVFVQLLMRSRSRPGVGRGGFGNSCRKPYISVINFLSLSLSPSLSLFLGASRDKFVKYRAATVQSTVIC